MQRAYDAALLDLDGVLYLGDDPVVGAAEGVRAARAAGMRVAFVTNNASRAPQDVADRLSGMQVPAEADDVVTSGQAAARLAAQALTAGACVLVLGTQALADELAGVGLRPVRRRAEAGDAGVAAVVQGLARQTSMADLADAAVALRRGALWIAGNSDATLPSPDGPLPGNGAFVDVLRTTTGLEPRIAGKPDPALHRESVERVAAQRPLVVGDRLETDVLGAVQGDADSLLVLTGVTDLALLCDAEPGTRPTFVAHDLSALGRPQPPVELDGRTARCGSAVLGWRDGRAEAQAGVHDGSCEDGARDAALRAKVALAWAAADGNWDRQASATAR